MNVSLRQKEYVRPLPAVQLIALIDILFINLSFFMALSLHFNYESQLNISVPEAKSALESRLAPEEIVINVNGDGSVVVNQKSLSIEQLEKLLKHTGELYPGQAVVLRADQKTYHQYVVRVLDVCAKSKIWNVSFATTKEG